ncbi:hypothetical protein [Saccharothrix sp. CB00851]|uniref:hypothetical protein n=1 Tax=Saccharothrix sp. CB00851 TaxID=1835005 RepID=UPI000A61A1D9|nr:hypothetical protein [Saccharothrix sp. CB00851]
MKEAGSLARITRAAVAVAVVVGVTSCESGVFDRPGGDTPTDPTTTTRPTGTDTGTTTTKGETRYGWFLPEGPDSPSFPEDDVYRPLKSRDCTTAQATLDAEWSAMTSPRNVLLYQAAVHLCRGEESAGRAMFGRASRYGWAMNHGGDGSGEVDCATYQAVRSVLEQRDPRSFTCVEGRPPEWPDDVDRDDPRTDTDRTTTTTTTTTSTTTTRTTTTTTTTTTS